MTSFVLVALCLFGFIPITNGLNCISCIGWSHSGCNDPYNDDTSGDIPVPGSTYCSKVVYPGYVERMAGGRSCTPGSGAGGSTRYCCSDKDYCNTMTSLIGSRVIIIIFITMLLLVKLKFSS